MKRRIHRSSVRPVLILLPVLFLWSLAHYQYLQGQNRPTPPSTAEGKEKAPPPSSQAWTLAEAREQLHLNPSDPYLQYVVLQLARRENRLNEVSGEVERLVWGGNPRLPGRANQVDLFSIFTGALAVQESLQLDTMRSEPPGRGQPTPQIRPPARPNAPLPGQDQPAARGKPGKEVVAVSTLTGPTVQSHPWEKLLGGKKPELSALSRYIPEDFFLVEFRSYNKLLKALELNDLWGTHLFNQATREARTQAVSERVKKQLAVETNPWTRLVADRVIEEIALTGSDLFFGEGTDLTLLFQSKQPEVFKAGMDNLLSEAEQAQPRAKRTTGTYQGISYIHVATPDRELDVYSAYPQPNLHVRSNSQAAFQRVLDAIKGKQEDGKAVRRLGDSLEFAYIRTLMPRGAKEEDGFVYLSDPLIRRLVGPQLKLTERRRMLCYNHLRMINHADLLYRTEFGKAPESLEVLANTKCAPGLFGEGPLACPDGGKYTLSADGMTGVCSHHGHSRSLTPCCEIPVKEVTREEAEEYKAFLQDYNQYWRTYFDPIALRLQITPERYRLETIVLPLIDNSIYTGLAHTLGGKAEPLDTLPVPKRNIFSVAVRVNKEHLLQEAGLAEAKPDSADGGKPGKANLIRCENNLKQITLALRNYESTYAKFPAVANFDKQGKPLLSWRVHLLPYLEQEQLYKEFHLDEPWDSEHNKNLIARMPAVYRCPSQKLSDPGKTTYLAPVGEKLMFTGGPKAIRIADVTDGTSNTIFLVDANDQHAVTWTKPDDWKYDPKQPRAGLVGHHQGGFVVVFVDGSIHVLRDTINPTTLQALLTRAGGEVVQLGSADEIPAGSAPGVLDIPGIPREQLDALKVQEFLVKGLGSQAGLHMYDSAPLIDFNMPAFLGMAAGSFNGRPNPVGTETLFISFLVASLTAPTYISFPVQDAKVVDEFLARLDTVLAPLARQKEDAGFLRFEQDFYQVPLDRETPVRTYGIRIGPAKWRFFWGRIGGGLYIASKPFIMEDLLALEAAKSKAESGARAGDPGPSAHAMIRMRPQNWNQVLTDYRLSWAENNREACLNNLRPLANVGRALAARAGGAAQPGTGVFERARRLYGVHFFCPEGGHYALSGDGKTCTCSVHGTVLAPHQPAAPGDNSATGKLIKTFTGMTATLTLREDGLHAVVTIDQK
jgi:hypothetical protein